MEELASSKFNSIDNVSLPLIPSKNNVTHSLMNLLSYIVLSNT